MSFGDMIPVQFYELAFLLTMLFLPVMAIQAEVEIFLFGAVVLFMCLRVIKKRRLKYLPTDGKAVFITGCDTGFGHMAAERLHSKGYKVFAGCLEPEGEGATDLKTKYPDNLHVLQIDVTDDASVMAARKYVEENLGDTRLWALVNNAGIFGLGDVELCTMKTFQELADVNYFGMIRVTQQFLPIIRKSSGRIVVMSSNSARFPWPTSSAYNASKAALECVTSCLRMEMKRFGVKVVSIQPAMFGGSTDLHGDKNLMRYKDEMDRCWAACSDEVKSAYHEKYIEAQISAVVSNKKSLDAKSPDIVIDAMEAGVSLKNPDIKYVVHGGPFFVDPIAIYGYIYTYLPETVTDWLACKVMGIKPQEQGPPSTSSPEVNGARKND